MCFIPILNSQILFSVQWFCKAEIVYWSCISILRQLLLFRFFKAFYCPFSRNLKMNQHFSGWTKYKEESMTAITTSRKQQSVSINLRLHSSCFSWSWETKIGNLFFPLQGRWKPFKYMKINECSLSY